MHRTCAWLNSSHVGHVSHVSHYVGVALEGVVNSHLSEVLKGYVTIVISLITFTIWVIPTTMVT